MYCNHLYSYYEERSSVHRRKCIDGKVTGSNRCSGYCECHLHPGFLTKELMNQHRCEQRACAYLIEKPKSIWKIDLKNNDIKKRSSQKEVIKYSI